MRPRIDKRVIQALENARAVLIRSNGHYVYQFPNGRHVTLSASPSDQNAKYNQLRDIRQALNGG